MASMEHCPPGDVTILGGPEPDIELDGDGVITQFRADKLGAPGAPLIFRVAEIDRVNNGYKLTAGVPAKLGATGSVTVPARIPVKNSHRVALTKPAGSQVACAVHSIGESPLVAEAPGLLPDGATAKFTTVMDRTLMIAAMVEDDVDSDGFGDQTQDKCIGQAGPAGGCPAGATRNEQKPGALCVVPRLTNLSIATAKKRIRAAGCSVGVVRRLPQARPAARVKFQSKPAGLEVPAGTKVSLKVR